MRSTTGRRTIAAVATAMSALGLLTCPVPAQAAPACEQYAFPGEVAIFEGDAGYAIRTIFSATGQTASGPASSKDTNGKGTTGTISGSITGRHINLAYSSRRN